MSLITYKLKRNRKLTPEQLKELEDLDRYPIKDDPEIPKNLDFSKARRLGDMRKRKSVDAVVAGDESGSKE